MAMRMRVGLPIGALLFLCAAAAFGNGRAEKTLRIMYTASLNGNLDGCSCTVYPRAGLVKRAAYLRSLADRSTMLLVDAGDILDAEPDQLLAREIFAVYSDLGYDAVALGDQELSNGLANAIEYGKSFPILSHNLSLRPEGSASAVYTPQVSVIHKRDANIGIVSLIDPAIFALYPESVKEAVQTAPCAKTARIRLQRFSGQGIDVRVLLFHGGLEAARALVREIPDFDVVVVGHEQLLVNAEKVGKTIIVSPGEEGNRVGILDLALSPRGVELIGNGFKLFTHDGDPDDPSVRARITAYDEQMGLRPRG
jgi:2',3'-cyclic-nucleotide 2'-phosphodiesterase (5'-nucleotidase family)